MDQIEVECGYESLSNRRKSHIRWMIRRDMVDVLQIEKDGFGPHAWSEEEFLAQLRNRNCIGMVAEQRDTILGYMVYELHKTRLHLMNFAVSKDFRYQGVGSDLVHKLVSKLSTHRRTAITAEVRESNLAAHLFFAKTGFRAERVRRGFFADNEDSYSFRYSIVPTTE